MKKKIYIYKADWTNSVTMEKRVNGKKIKIGEEILMILRTHLASNSNWEIAIVVLPECREYPELQQWVFANAYFSNKK